MNVIKEYKGYQLIERYGKNYIRFWGGREEDMPCEFPVSKADAERVINEASVIDELLSIAKTQIEWTANSFYKIGITEYILHRMKLSQTIAEKSYEKMARYADICKEFYRYIMDDETFPSNPIRVEGFTAQQLATDYPLSPLGAYTYLIYLHEMPDKALADLEAGLPTKMTKKELLEWYNSIHYDQMPRYTEATDANNSQLLVGGEWKNIVFAWALFFDGHKWKYAETDSERGYILDVKTFETEFAAVEYAKSILSKIYLSTKDNSKMEMLCRFIQNKFGYSEKKSQCNSQSNG